MSEDLNVNGYTCETKAIYDALKSANVKSSKLKAIDKNSDKKISEDEYQEYLESEDEEEKSSSSVQDEYSDDPTVQSLQRKYDREQRAIYRLQLRIKSLNALLKEAEGNLAGYPKDSDSRESMQAVVDSVQEKIDSATSEIASHNATMSNIMTSIQNRKNQLANEAALSASMASSAETSASSTSGAGSVGTTTPISAESGSGSDLAGVTGDLSICLDRVAKSLGTSRNEAADYIATLCKTVGKGYFNPKVILSQIFSESGGDNSASSTPTYVGFGQMSAVAVQEVNNQFGTNYSFADMHDPAKNLQAMIYLMRFQYERYGHDIGKALTAYNVGNCSSGVVNDYARKILSRV